jgi:4-amino-4-deoxy-L-arabinose transferase-like glycosyltransferase
MEFWSSISLDWQAPTANVAGSLSFQVFGINNFGARFVTVIFSMLSLSMLYFLGKKLYNPYVGALSVLVLGTFANYIEFSRRAMIDIQLIFFMLASIYVFILSRESGKNRNRYLVLSGLLFGLALMTKQVQALLIPLILLGYLILSERKIRFGFKRFLVFLGIGLLVFVPWVIVMHFKFGEEFWLWTFLYSGYMRSINSLEGHVGDFTYYFYYLYTGENLLWAILLPFATAFCIFKGFFKKVKADVLVFVWIAVVFLVFTVAQTKLYWYLLPAYPACALAIGSLLYKISQKLKTYQKTHKLPIKR